jgi:hypothetical protein
MVTMVSIMIGISSKEDFLLFTVHNNKAKLRIQNKPKKDELKFEFPRKPIIGLLGFTQGKGSDPKF